jgi:hypothetical protein
VLGQFIAACVKFAVEEACRGFKLAGDVADGGTAAISKFTDEGGITAAGSWAQQDFFLGQFGPNDAVPLEGP